jgi:c(7)-type cytochrome triheme protein
MNRTAATILLLLLAAICTAAYAETNKGAALINLYSGKKKSIQFPHATHQTSIGDCSVCHTLFPMTKDTIRERIEQGTMEKKTVMNKCRDCHKAMEAENKKTGPTSCSKCHTG